MSSLIFSVKFINCPNMFGTLILLVLINSKGVVPFSLVHSDVWEPSPTTYLFGFHYFISFVDDYSRCTWVYFMKTKGEVSSIFHAFHKMVQTQFGASIKVLRSDNGGEYISSQLQTYLTECGIIHQTLCVHTPQQNGVIELKNRHLLELPRALKLFCLKPFLPLLI